MLNKALPFSIGPCGHGLHDRHYFQGRGRLGSGFQRLHSFQTNFFIWSDLHLYVCADLLVYPLIVIFFLCLAAVGIIGATVMPHSLFLGSALATQDRIDFRPDDDNDADSLKNVNADERGRAGTNNGLGSMFYQFCSNMKESVMDAFRKPPPNLYARAATKHSDHTNNPDAFVRAHIYHGTADIVGSLLGFAVMINSLCVPFLTLSRRMENIDPFGDFIRILMLASAVFFYGRGYDGSGDPASLFDAYDLIKDIVGQGT